MSGQIQYGVKLFESVFHPTPPKKISKQKKNPYSIKIYIILKQ